ncbi:MAG: tRNA guanosine(15) transglycosylase TgtA [Thaumarchaeota archaeon]|nr:tRNA guanosine(15) transglycosylase TgtA [Nitrososphaerota archaeon]
MFEVKSTDLAGRIGRLKTRNGEIETPYLLPVIHPASQSISVDTISNIGFPAVITNAYLTLKHFGDKAKEKGIHSIIDFDGIIMTDSGGYQILEYGEIEADPTQMARYQEGIGSDIAVVLDTPTGSSSNRRWAETTVKKSLDAAKLTLKLKKKDNTMMWSGPVQGGNFPDLVRTSARSMAALDFDIYAIGSPTEMIKNYHFSDLVRMVMTAKRELPLNKPVHLFGVGHPFTLSIAVAMGCDIFDSASYILYAKRGRYMTSAGTLNLEKMSYFPCVCPICSKWSVKELLESDRGVAVQELALHNLYALKNELDKTKEAIREGRLWEHVGSMARNHPKLWAAFLSLSRYSEELEEGTPLFKEKGLFLSSAPDEKRPEVRRFYRSLDRVTISKKKRIALILPETRDKPFLISNLYLNLTRAYDDILDQIQVCFIAPVFGLIPVEISDIYPLSQYVCSYPLDNHFTRVTIVKIKEFLARRSFKHVIIVDNSEDLHEVVKRLKSGVANATFVKALDIADDSDKLVERLNPYLSKVRT